MLNTSHRHQVEQEVLAKLEECKKTAAAKGYPIDFNVEFLYRGTNGGHYKHSAKTIAINIALACLNESNKKHILDETCPHECIHAAEFQHFTIERTNKTRKVHGWRFYHLGRVIFNKELSRCHDMDTDGVVRRHARPFIYACKCREHSITRNIHNKILMGQRRACSKCKSLIILVNKNPKEIIVIR